MADEYIIDFNGRDKCRTPMQWDNTIKAGFSSTTKKTWLPISTNYKLVIVQLQKSSNRSHLNVFQKLCELRENPTMKYSALTIEAINNNILAYKRQIDGETDVVAIILNFGSSSNIVDVNVPLDGLPDQMETFVSSTHSDIEGTVDTHKLYVPPKTGLVLIGKEEGNLNQKQHFLRVQILFQSPNRNKKDSKIYKRSYT